MKTSFVLLFICYSFLAYCQNNSIENPHIKWTFKAKAPVRGGSVTDQENIYFGDSDGNVYSLDKQTGKQNWVYKTGGAITCSPAIGDGKIIVSSRDNFAYAIEVAEGKLAWKFQMQKATPHTWGWDYYSATPVINGKNVLVGSADHHLYALNLESGKLGWQFEAKDKIRATPLIHKNKIFAPAFDGYVYVLDAKHGELLNRYETEGVDHYGKIYGWDRTSITTKPAIQDSLLVFGSRDGGLYCINSENLHKKWRFSYGSSWVGSSPVVNNSTVYVGWSDQLYFSAVDLLSGKEQWSYNCHSYVYSTPVCDAKNVYVGAFDGKLYGFDKMNGNVKWLYQTSGSVLSSPLLEESTLFVGNDNGDFYAFENGDEVLKAVYLPESYQNNELLNSEKITPYLMKSGYKRLDTLSLGQFMQRRILDKKSSVVVFAHQYLPHDVSGEHASESLLKKYMETGGKVVWLGYFPKYWKADKDMNIVGFYPEYAEELLDIKFDVNMDFGTYYAKSTDEGVKLGLPLAYNSMGSSIADESKVIPLAFNEFGRITSFRKPFGQNDYSGFILFRSWFYMPIQNSDLEVIKAIADYGL